MSYRSKNCPVCSTEHKKRGPYCSKSCSNAGRVVKQSTKEKHSSNQLRRMEKGSEHYDKSIESLQKINDPEARQEPVAPLAAPPLGVFRAGKDLWYED